MICEVMTDTGPLVRLAVRPVAEVLEGVEKRGLKAAPKAFPPVMSLLAM